MERGGPRLILVRPYHTNMNEGQRAVGWLPTSSCRNEKANIPYHLTPFDPFSSHSHDKPPNSDQGNSSNAKTVPKYGVLPLLSALTGAARSRGGLYKFMYRVA